jgi:hypothetical protein
MPSQQNSARPIRLKVRGRSRPGSLIEGIHAIKTQKNFAVNVLKKYMRISDPEILEEGYHYALRFYPAEAISDLRRNQGGA